MDGWDHKPEEWEEETDKLKLQLDRVIRSNIKPYPQVEKYKHIQLEAIFVLAGGLQDNGEVHEWVMRRLNLAYQVYKSKKHKPKIICLGGGTYHKPPIRNSKEFVVHESTSCAEYLIRLGVNPKDVYKEWASYDTVAGGVFAYFNFIRPMNLQKILIVTSEFHMRRTKAIFQWILGLEINSKVQTYYEQVTDKGIEVDIINIRREREARSFQNLQRDVISQVETIPQLHSWFYEEHKAYCSNSEIIRRDETSDKEKLSY